MKLDFITIGGATEDVTLFTAEAQIVDNRKEVLAQKLIAFEYGAKIQIDKTSHSFGGGASNAAVCYSSLGFKAAALVAVGGDQRGKSVLENFKKRGVSLGLVQKIEDEETGFTFLIVGKDKEHVGFSSRGANRKLAISEKELRKMDTSNWVYVTSLSGSWKNLLNQIFKTKAKIAWNPGHIQLHAGFKAIGKYIAKTDVLTVNKDEAIELVVTNEKYRDKDNRFLNNVKNLLAIIQGYGAKIVVITNGKHGADVYDGKSFYHEDILSEVKVVDTTGVGDAFGSSFCAGLEIFKGDIRKAMKLGMRNTASVVGKQGAQNGLLSKAEVLKQIK